MVHLTDTLLGYTVKAWIVYILPVSFLLYHGTWILYARTLHPLAQIPGPFWPSISRTWLMYKAYTGDIEIVLRRLHDIYGPLLRVAPDEIVCSDPREIPVIYPVSKPLQKTVWYLAWRPIGIGSRPDMFSNLSETDHAVYRKLIGHVYSVSSVLQNEPEIDKTVSLFLDRLDDFATESLPFDFGLWLEMYCYDNIGVVFLGKQFGFLRERIDYAAPTYMRPLVKTAALAIPKLLKSILAADGIRQLAVRETYEAHQRFEANTSKRPDLTSKLMSIVREKGVENNFGWKEVVMENFTGVMAGADSASIELRSIFYYLMKHPDKLAKVRLEIDTAYDNGSVSSPAQYNQAIQLEYFMAVVKESFRLFPPLAVSVQRYSPAQGIILAGTFIPGGWRIGLNPGVVQYNKEVFGEDAASFRPERWLEDVEQARLMERCMMHFGVGTRTCTGKHIALIETYKIVPEILRRYDLEMAHDGPWKTQNAGFNFQTGVECRFKMRLQPRDVVN